MHEMSAEEIREFVQRNRFGVLGLADGDRAYAVPMYYGHDGGSFYFQTREGLKDRFIARTSEACFIVARVLSLEDWASVQAFGKLERLADGLDASEALLRVPLPPDWGESETGMPRRGDHDVTYYRLTPTRLAGRHSEHAAPSREEREIAFGGM